jgi:hypothetical protein
MALAVAFAVAADYLPGHGQVFGTLRVWQVHLILSPLVGVPVGLFCAYWVRQRNVPSNDQVG